MGGTDDPDNLIELTVEEHAEAHRKLYEEHGRIEDYCAWKGLEAEIGKAEIRAMVLKEKLTGVPIPKERARKISKALTGRKLSEEHKAKIGKAHRGKIVSEETRRKMSLAKIGNKNRWG